MATSPRRIVDPDTSDGDAFESTPQAAAGELRHRLRPGDADQPPPVLARRQRSGVRLRSSLRASPRAEARRAQSAVVAQEVDALLAADPEAKIVVLGDFNAFYFEPPLTELEGDGRLFNLHRDLPEDARYTYVFEGQGQALDHALVSEAAREGATLSILHINAGRLSPASDHDPYVVALAPGQDGGPPPPT